MNNVSKKSVINVFLLLLIIVNIISFTNMSIFVAYEKVSFYINLLSIACLFIFQKKIYKYERGKLLFLMIFGAYGVSTLLFTGGGFGSVLTPIYSMLLIIVLSRCSFTKKMIKLLLMVLLTVNFILIYNSPGYYVKALYNQDSYLNSNTIAMVISYTAIYSKILIKKLEVKYSNIITILLFGFSIWGILNCQARGSLLTLLAFILLDTLVPKVFWKSRVRTIITIITIIALGIIIPFIMVQLYNNGIEFDIPFTSKSLYTGREVIWSNFYSIIGNNLGSWFLGLGSDVILWDAGSISLHNNYLAIISNFGVIGFVMYYGYFLTLINGLYTNNKLTNYQISLLIGFICVLLNGLVEITTLWDIMFYFNFMFLAFIGNEVNHNSDLN